MDENSCDDSILSLTDVSNDNTYETNLTRDLMDFENLIGPSAYLAKQLTIRWFYSWDSSFDKSDELFDLSLDDTHRRLVRKRYHSMPFLPRNISRHPFKVVKSNRYQHRKSSNKKRRPPKKSACVDVIHRCTGNSFRNRSRTKRKRESHVCMKNQNQVLNEAIDIKQVISNRRKQYRRREEDKKCSKTLLKQESDDTSDPLKARTAYQLYSQSSLVRDLVLKELDPTLHHDEEFVENRIKRLWKEILSSDNGFVEGNVEVDESENSQVSAVEENIKSYAYWFEREKIEKERLKEGVEGKLNNKLATSQGQTKYSLLLTDHEICVPHAFYLSSERCLIDRSARKQFKKVAKNHQPLQPAYFHYIHTSPGGDLSTVVERRNDRRCPFCSINGNSNEELLWHCSVFHGILVDHYPWEELRHGLYFQGALDEERQLHVVVRGGTEHILQNKTEKNFTFIRSKSPVQKNLSIPFIIRPYEKVISLDPVKCKSRLQALEANKAPHSAIASYLPTDQVPVRQYFHSRTNLPMSHGDWDIDSDDESDDTWLNDIGSDLLDEFEDVSEQEKKFMKMWNRFTMSHHVIADRDIPETCHEFISSNKREMKIQNMRENLLLHLMNLWDFGIISSTMISALMYQFDTGDDYT